MRNKFEEIMQSLIECFNLNRSQEAHSDVEDCHECDGITPCPNKPSQAAEGDSDTNMLLRDMKKWSK